jgi:hypothetical protein
MTSKFAYPLGLDKQAIAAAKTAVIKLGECRGCLRDVISTDFKDPISRREFAISGLCQSCQDGIFGP